MKRATNLFTALLLSTGVFAAFAPPAFAKASMSMQAREHTVPVGAVIHFSGYYGDDAGDEGQRICLYAVTPAKALEPLASCVSLHQSNGSPITGPGIQEGYFTVNVIARKPGTLTVVPLIERNGQVLSYDVAQGLPDYAVTVTVTTKPGATNTRPAVTPSHTATSTQTVTPSQAIPSSPGATQLTAADATKPRRFPLAITAAVLAAACLGAAAVYLRARHQRDKQR